MESRHFCNTCGKAVGTRRELKNHRKLHSVENQDRVVCKIISVLCELFSSVDGVRVLVFIVNVGL